jgi:hypothetical protein
MPEPESAPAHESTPVPTPAPKPRTPKGPSPTIARPGGSARKTAAPVLDPFAPPPDPGLAKVELAARVQERRVTHAQPTTERAAYEEVNAYKRTVRDPQLLIKKLILYLGGALAAGALLLVYQSQSKSQRLPPPGAAAIEAAPQRSFIKLAELPERSWVFLDGVRTVMNPIEMRPSATPHELRIECDGYATRTITFVPLPGEVVVDAKLEKIEPPGKRRRKP